MKSLDPRVNRLHLSEDINLSSVEENQFITFEVFHQEKRGKQAVHVGVVHAPSPEIALIVAKEQYTRRKSTASLWVVKSSDIHCFSNNDEDIFSTTPEKQFREPGFYKVRERIEQYQASTLNKK